jgi:hypothetical protein
MSSTYTSADLAEIAASIPSRASEAGLVIVPGVSIAREVDVQINGHEADIAAALQIARLVKAPFISVDPDPFWAD